MIDLYPPVNIIKVTMPDGQVIVMPIDGIHMTSNDGTRTEIAVCVSDVAALIAWVEERHER